MTISHLNELPAIRDPFMPSIYISYYSNSDLSQTTFIIHAKGKSCQFPPIYIHFYSSFHHLLIVRICCEHCFYISSLALYLFHLVNHCLHLHQSMSAPCCESKWSAWVWSSQEWLMSWLPGKFIFIGVFMQALTGWYVVTMAWVNSGHIQSNILSRLYTRLVTKWWA